MAELRDSIKANWLTTGQELGKDLRQFWQSSRPASPARTPTQEKADVLASPTGASSSALSRLSHLDIPRIGSSQGTSSEFAAGYSLGLIGGVRSWVRVSDLWVGSQLFYANTEPDGPKPTES
jgi:choline-phosphate cytidylyltransferase